MEEVKMVISKEYGYVVLVLVLYCLFNLWMGFQVGKARKKYGVNYPTLYASESENKNAKLFNCVQRGHQNSLEYMPVYFILSILGGMKHPCVCAGLGFVYLITRYFYFTGYSSGDPQKRLFIGFLRSRMVDSLALAPDSVSRLSLRPLPPLMFLPQPKIEGRGWQYRKYGFAALLGLLICTISFGVHLIIA